MVLIKSATATNRIRTCAISNSDPECNGSSFPDEPFFNRPPPPPGAGPFPFDDFAPRNARRGKSKDAKN
ncbi:hypothetical protein J6590_096061 [Homalodisca vitripennis]|nr:hypothetical protein J6590_096061 [Homalodisca vitripennis]